MMPPRTRYRPKLFVWVLYVCVCHHYFRSLFHLASVLVNEWFDRAANFIKMKSTQLPTQPLDRCVMKRQKYDKVYYFLLTNPPPRSMGDLIHQKWNYRTHKEKISGRLGKKGLSYCDLHDIYTRGTVSNESQSKPNRLCTKIKRTQLFGALKWKK